MDSQRSDQGLDGFSEDPELLKHIFEVYQVKEVSALRQGVRLGRAKILDSGEDRDLLFYDLQGDKRSLEQIRQFHLQEFNALNALRSTGLVPLTEDHFSWSEEVLILSIKPLEGTTLAAYDEPQSEQDLYQDLLLASSAFHGLSIIHQRGILHRALMPENLFIQEAGKSVAFANFYASCLGKPEPMMAAALDALMIDDPYIAPELVSGYSLANSGTDVFSLGLLFLQRWSNIPLHELRPLIQQPARVPNLQERWPTLPANMMQELTVLCQAICGPAHKKVRPPAEEVSQRLLDLAERLRRELNMPEISEDSDISVQEEEIGSLLHQAMKEFGLAAVDNSVSHLLRYLTAVSGKLPNPATEMTTKAAAAAGLGIVAAWLQKQGRLKQSVLMPIDPHAHLFTSQSTKAAQQGKQRCDLALFSFQPNILGVTFIEVKWRKNHETLDVLGSSMYIQMKSSRQAFQDRFFGSEPMKINRESRENGRNRIESLQNDEPVNSKEHAVQRSYLTSVLITYLEHSCRYGLFDKQAKQTFLDHLSNFKMKDLEFRPSLEGYIVSLHDSSTSFKIMDAQIHVLTAADFDQEIFVPTEENDNNTFSADYEDNRRDKIESRHRGKAGDPDEPQNPAKPPDSSKPPLESICPSKSPSSK